MIRLILQAQPRTQGLSYLLCSMHRGRDNYSGYEVASTRKHVRETKTIDIAGSTIKYRYTYLCWNCSPIMLMNDRETKMD